VALLRAENLMMIPNSHLLPHLTDYHQNLSFSDEISFTLFTDVLLIGRAYDV
jgi:hypothetical protein